MRRLVTLFASLALLFVLASIVAGGGAGAETAAPPSESPSPSPSPTEPPPSVKEPDLAPSAHHFGSVCVGTSSDPVTFTITNKDNDVLVIDSVQASAPFHAGAPAEPTLLAGRSTTFTAVFRPTAPGPAGVAVVVETDHGTVQANLTGTAFDRQVSVAPSSLSFGPQKTRTESAARTVTIANAGAESLAVSDLSLGGADASNFTLIGPRSFVLAAGETQRVSLTFKSASDGPKSAALRVSSNACLEPVRSVSLSGSGARPAITVRPSKLELAGTVGKEGPAESVSVTDSGDAPLIVTSIKLTGANAKEFAMTGLPRLPVTVIPGDAFEFDVRFLPLAVTDPPPTAEIEIASNDAKARVVTVPVTVVYVTPSPTPSPTPTASAAPPPPPKDRGPRFGFGALAGYVSVLVVMLIVVGAFAALVGVRELKRRRVVRRWTSSQTS